MSKMRNRELDYKFIEPDKLYQYTCELGYLLKQHNSYAMIQAFGGGALVLGYGVRRPTEDIDMRFIDGNKELFDRLVDELAKKYSLGRKWVNNSGTVFLPYEVNEDPDTWYRDFDNLRIYFVSLAVLLAMKIRAYRPKDMKDLVRLVRALNITSANQVVMIHDKYFEEGEGMEYLPENEILYRAERVLSYSNNPNYVL